jgi:hypothetical protein
MLQDTAGYWGILGDTGRILQDTVGFCGILQDTA